MNKNYSGVNDFLLFHTLMNESRQKILNCKKIIEYSISKHKIKSCIIVLYIYLRYSILHKIFILQYSIQRS